MGDLHAAPPRMMARTSHHLQLLWQGLVLAFLVFNLLEVHRVQLAVVGTVCPESVVEPGESTVVAPANQKELQQHPIPRRLIFTHSQNLLETTTNLTDPVLETLRNNVIRTVALHPEATVHFYTNEHCEAILERIGYSHLVPHFRNETKGMFKGDMCRGAALYESGGVYFDVDLGVRTNVWEVLAPDTEFATIHAFYKNRKYKDTGFFQAFIAAAPQHPVLREYLDLFYEYYQGRHKVKGLLGVLLLRQAYDKVQPSHTELWHEVHYDPTVLPALRDVPPPTWGKKINGCKMVVITDLTSETAQTPFYSRIEGAHNCLIDRRRGS